MAVYDNLKISSGSCKGVSKLTEIKGVASSNTYTFTEDGVYAINVVHSNTVTPIFNIEDIFINERSLYGSSAGTNGTIITLCVAKCKKGESVTIKGTSGYYGGAAIYKFD